MPDRDGLTPLHFAVKRNHINLARQILSICPETVNSYDKRGLTPFVLAILIGADQVTRELSFRFKLFARLSIWFSIFTIQNRFPFPT